ISLAGMPDIRGGVWRAGLLVGVLTERIMERYNIQMDTPLFRNMSQRFLDMTNGLVSGNANSMARVLDLYNAPSRINPHWTPAVSDWVPRLLPAEIEASTLGPSLNVSLTQTGAYLGEADRVTIMMRTGDLISQGARIYPDVSAVIQGAQPFIFTL